MPRITVKDLNSSINALVERLDNAAHVVKAQAVRIQALEEQQIKTRKQLWYLQKIAKGEFKPQVPKPQTKSQAIAQVDAYDDCSNF